tara:strand:- start:1322 stop:2413 length:1092 start_codon:yes stop_codon:yes gene_type:complete
MKLDTIATRLAFQRLDPASCDSNKYMWMNPMEMDRNNDDIIYWAEGNKLWRNNDLSSIAYNSSHQKSDLGWDMFSDTLPNQNLKISVITTSLNPKNVVYFGTQNKDIYRVDDAHIGDPVVTQLSNIPTVNNSYCTDIAVNPDNADELIVVYSNYSIYSLFHSNDGGQNWNKIAGNLEQDPSGSGNGPSCRTAEIIPLGNSTLYLVGTTVGLFGTANLDGQNTVWEQIGHNAFGSTIVEFLTYRPSDGLLVVGTFGNGVYQSNLNSISDVLGVENQVQLVDLDWSIFPNPTNDKATITYKLNIASEVKINVIDELGKKIKLTDLYYGIQGANSIKLDLTNLKSGIYFVNMSVEGQQFTKQIIKK